MERSFHRFEGKPNERLSVADIIVRYRTLFLEKYGDTLSLEQRSALQSISTCRTEAMGGHRYACPCCDEQRFAWHSCNHRLCPRCGSSETERWVSEKLENALPIDHYMVTFTLPSQLRSLCRYQAKAFLGW